MTDTPEPQVIGQAGGIDARGERYAVNPDAPDEGYDFRAEPHPDAEHIADQQRAALMGTSDAAAYAEAESLDAAADELDPDADFLACDAPLTVCAATHNHRDVGDLRPGGVFRARHHDHDNYGGSPEFLRSHLAEQHGMAHPADSAYDGELAEWHTATHNIEGDAAKAFRSTASLGAVLAGLIHGDWVDAADELTDVAAEQAKAGDLEPITALLWTFEKARKALQLSEDALKARLSAIMRFDLKRPKTAVVGFGSLEAKAGAKRKDWDVDRAVAMVAHRGMEKAGILDPDTGEVDADRHADYQAGVADVLAAGTLSLRVGGLAGFGLNADDFCTTEYGRATVIARWNDGL